MQSGRCAKPWKRQAQVDRANRVGGLGPDARFHARLAWAIFLHSRMKPMNSATAISRVSSRVPSKSLGSGKPMSSAALMYLVGKELGR